MKNKLLLFSRLLLILLFLYTLIHKIIDIKSFENTLLKSTIISNNQVQLLLYFTPLAELFVIISLFLKKRIIGFYLSFILMLVFTLYLVALNNFSFYKGCSCGGIFNELTYLEHIIINISFLLIALLSIMLFENKEKEKTIQEEM